MRPTPEQIEEARCVLTPTPVIGGDAALTDLGQRAVRVLLAATEPPTEWDIAYEAARYATGLNCGGTATDDALAVMRGEDVPTYVPAEFIVEVRAFVAGARWHKGGV
jgi:hypothetical protein